MNATKSVVVITNVDSLLGFSLAYRFLKRWKEKHKTEFRLLCRHKEGLQELQNLGGKVIEIQDYSDKDTIMNVLKSATYVMYLLESSLEEGKLLIECARDSKVDYLAMFSFVGLHKDMSDSYIHLHDYYKLEKHVGNCFDKDSYCIFQSSLWHQMFYYFGPMIEDDNKITLLMDKNKKWGTIDLLNLIDAVFHLSTSWDHRRHSNKTVFKFTPEKYMKTKEMTQAASDGLDRKEIEYKQVKYKDLFEYLDHVHNDNRFRLRPEHDHSFTFPLGTWLHKDVIETMLEYMQLVDESDMKETLDLKDALEKPPITIQEFFKSNKDQFRKLK